ncbi:hypothetical protein ASPVEDRAFT_88462 [Aspergillus versicolor CBS 583.65]|uniref:Uncharacterized protein n=1 Tax=Aspergillus versicolor CBS 583.65 TaxID=1036611 RepID=A0A1L9Q0C9_ASPVE|nr:uncharacterized protein ASPVEDRAFT_88462 [Aspergillus versicolor CBS 583.65]OJJ07208.1 hypothetical protein ASPVEDRAFT_88462 [Aspergillus versicolor CBS 583.65]
MSFFERTLSFASSLSSSPPSQPSSGTMCRRQDTDAHYLTRAKLQRLLENKFPNHPGKDFHIRLFQNVWSFDAPEEVTQAELQ